jgi:hypothetical protein
MLGRKRRLPPLSAGVNQQRHRWMPSLFAIASNEVDAAKNQCQHKALAASAAASCRALRDNGIG